MKHFIILVLMGLCLVACQGDQNQEELEQLQGKNERLLGQIKQDNEILNEWSEERITIDSLLQTVEELKDSAQSELFPKARLQEKIAATVVVLEEKQANIEKLSQALKIKNTPISNNLSQSEKGEETSSTRQLIQESIDNYKAKLRKQQQLIKELEEEVSNLEGQVDNLQGQNKGLERTINDKDVDLAEKNRLLSQKERELNDRELQLKNAQNTLKRSQQEARTQFNQQKVIMAQALIQAVRSVPGAGRRKKQTIINKAWELLCEGHQAGVNQAMGEMDVLKRDQVLGKFVSNKPNCIR